MKILQILSSKDLGGGTQEHIRILCAGLKSKGHTVKIICRPGSLVEAYSNEGFDVQPIELRDKDKAVKELLDLMSKEHFDVVHTHNRDADVVGLISAKKSNVSLIISTIHDFLNIDESGQRKMNFPLWKYNRILKKIPHKLIAISDSIKTNILEKLKVNQDKVITIYNGTDLSMFPDNVDIDNKKKEFNIPDNVSVVGVVGRLIIQKGHQYFLESIPFILRENKNILFLVVGKGKLKEGLELLAKNLNISQYVRFIGYRRDVNIIIRLMDIVIVPSIFEAFGRVVTDSMACSKPIIAARVGGLEEIMVDGETGVLVPPKDAQAIANAIIGLLKDKIKAKQLGENGRKRVEEKFNGILFVDNTEKLFKDLIKEKRRQKK